MSDGGGSWSGRVPADVAAVGLTVVLTLVSVFTPGLRETPVRIVVGLLFVLFVPGYAVVAALFPRRDGSTSTDGQEKTEPQSFEYLQTGRINGIERVVFAVGTSIVLVFAVGVGLVVSPWRISLVPIVASVSGIALLGATISAERRRRVPETERFRVTYREWLAPGRAGRLQPETRTDAVLTVVTVVGLLLAIGSIGYAVSGPSSDSSTEFSLLVETETGAMVAPDSSANLTLNDSRPLVVGISNHEGERVEYSVVVVLQEIRIQDGEVQVIRQERLQSFQTALSDDETWRQGHAIAPTFRGENLRLTYLLYQGDVPSDASVDTATQELHIWVET